MTIPASEIMKVWLLWGADASLSVFRTKKAAKIRGEEIASRVRRVRDVSFAEFKWTGATLSGRPSFSESWLHGLGCVEKVKVEG